MMVLCPIHHHEATVGALSELDQRQLKNEPYNVQHGLANGQLVIAQRCPAVQLGSVQFAGNGPVLAVGDRTIFAVASDDAGRLLLTFDLYDQKEMLLLSVHENEWISGDPFPWDMEFGYNTLVLRLAPRSLTLTLDARESPAQVTGDFWWQGQQFAVSRTHVTINGAIEDVLIADLAFAGASLTIDIPGRRVGIVPHPDVEHAAIVSWPDPAERIQKAINAYAGLQRRDPPRSHW